MTATVHTAPTPRRPDRVGQPERAPHTAAPTAELGGRGPGHAGRDQQP